MAELMPDHVPSTGATHDLPEPPRRLADVLTSWSRRMPNPGAAC
jgi:hypothetical protein